MYGSLNHKVLATYRLLTGTGVFSPIPVPGGLCSTQGQGKPAFSQAQGLPRGWCSIQTEEWANE